MLWIKAFHLIFMVAWFAGIFYLPRIFVNQAMETDPATQERLTIMARKLYRFVTPFMILTLIFGIWLTSYNLDYYKVAGWYKVKVSLVMLLVIYHFICGVYRKQLAEGRCKRSHIFFRFFNEFPVIILFAVIILASVKPF